MPYYISNKDLQTLIRIETLIGENEKNLFRKKGEKKFYTDENGVKRLDYQERIDPASGITNSDFNDFMNFIENAIAYRKENSRRATAWNKAHRKVK